MTTKDQTAAALSVAMILAGLARRGVKLDKLAEGHLREIVDDELTLRADRRAKK